MRAGIQKARINHGLSYPLHWSKIQSSKAGLYAEPQKPAFYTLHTFSCIVSHCIIHTYLHFMFHGTVFLKTGLNHNFHISEYIFMVKHDQILIMGYHNQFLEDRVFTIPAQKRYFLLKSRSFKSRSFFTEPHLSRFIHSTLYIYALPHKFHVPHCPCFSAHIRASDLSTAIILWPVQSLYYSIRLEL